MEQGPSGANSRSGSQACPRLLWETKVNYSAHKSSPLDLSESACLDLNKGSDFSYGSLKLNYTNYSI
jgi:hypothetical protein